MQSIRDPIRRRQPIERPLDIIGLELLVTVTQALLAGILLSLAAQLGGDARAYGLPVPGLLAVLAVTVGVGWLRWLVGGSGWVMASVGLATAILTGALWLLALQDATLPRIDWLVGLLAAACAIYGLIAGVFLDGPHRTHWKGGVSQPRRGMPQTRATPARFSPPVQRVVDERLAGVRLPPVGLPSAARLRSVGIPRPTRVADAPPETSGDGLAIAADVPPAPPAVTQAEPSPAVASVAEPEAPPVDVAPAPVAEDPAPLTTVPAEPVGASTAAGAATAAPGSHDPTEPVGPLATDETAVEPAQSVEPLTPIDPDAPTQPIARPATEWPRPIEPRTRTGAHKVDPSG